MNDIDDYEFPDDPDENPEMSEINQIQLLNGSIHGFEDTPDDPDENPEMSEINQIQLPNGSIYGFEDTFARDEVTDLEERVNSLSKADVGLGNVDNTSDVDKPYYKLIGQTATNTNEVGHFNFNDASRSLYKIKNFYTASVEGDYFYLAHKKSDYTITATKHFSHTDDLFTANLSSDCDCRIATNLISESDPAILTIVRKNEFEASKQLNLTLIFYEDMGLQSNARLNHWKLETMISTGQSWEWLTVFERTNVSDSINCLWCGLNPKDNWAYLRIKGIRITIYAATPCATQSWAFGYNQLRIAGMRLLESRPLFSPAEALGALDVAGGTVYGKTTFQEGISATSYSGATATSSADGLMSKDDKAKLDTLLEKLYPVGSIYMSVNATNPAELFGGTWERIKDRFLLAAGNIYAAGSTGGWDTHIHKYGFQYGAFFGSISMEKDDQSGALQGGTGNPVGSTVAGQAHSLVNNNVAQDTKNIDNTHYKSIADTSSASNMPPYLAVYMWKRTA